MRMLTEAAGSVARSPESLADLQVRPQVHEAGKVHPTEDVSRQQLVSLLNQIQSVTRDAETQVLGRSHADLTTRPEPASWSVAECLDHLAQTTRAFLPAISDAMAAAPNLTTRRRLRTGTLARFFIRNLEPPYRLRFKVLPQIAPQQQDFETAWSGFVQSQSQLEEAVRSAAGLAVDRVRIKSPVYARVSYNVYGAFRILAAHERRHLWQVEQTLHRIDRARAARNGASPVEPLAK